MSDKVEITVRGRVGTEPVRRVGASGTTWVTFRLGATPRARDRVTGEYKNTETQWFTVKTWGDFAENVGVSLGRGVPVLVQGRVYVDTWSGEGGERWDHVIHAQTIGVELFGGTVKYLRTIRESAAAPPEGAPGATPDLTGLDGQGERPLSDGAPAARPVDPGDDPEDGTDLDEKRPGYLMSDSGIPVG
ncbi:single-stranded DNA-binding protein [Georgenia sp. SYP-B2076]|uniref:single-stranded DNA-binding protein n=1 Tax=Georgenia sp. SYP-B2076 TaxID=2495881 RepID=UPI000F8DBE01|nr:single-stranded DNA-binding protein [Georgenia sp. SYP-B2076]